MEINAHKALISYNEVSRISIIKTIFGGPTDSGFKLIKIRLKWKFKITDGHKVSEHEVSKGWTLPSPSLAKFIIHSKPQVAQAPKGAINMTLRNSVIFVRVCMGIEQSYKIV